MSIFSKKKVVQKVTQRVQPDPVLTLASQIGPLDVTDAVFLHKYLRFCYLGNQFNDCLFYRCYQQFVQDPTVDKAEVLSELFIQDDDSPMSVNINTSQRKAFDQALQQALNTRKHFTTFKASHFQSIVSDVKVNVLDPLINFEAAYRRRDIKLVQPVSLKDIKGALQALDAVGFDLAAAIFVRDVNNPTM